MKKTWVTGYHAVHAVLAQNPERAINLYVVSNARHSMQQQLLSLAQQLGVSVQTLDKAGLAKLCQSTQNQGIALQAKPKAEGNEKQLCQLIKNLVDEGRRPLLLILDQVQDPHNLGACLRTADAAGVDAVIVPKDNASPITPVVQKVASGAVETVALFRVSNLGRVIDAIKALGVWVIGTSDKAEGTLYQQDLTGPLAIVMGAEGEGMRALTQKKCDLLMSLPMAGTIVSSLNVSVATGVCLYEAVRQRQSKIAGDAH